MKTVIYTILHLVAITSVLSKDVDIHGFIRNVQVADGSSFAFPGSSPPPPEREIPIELLLQMGDVVDTREFFEKFVYADDGDDDNVTLSSLSPFFGHDVIERSTARQSLKIAKCQPELKTVRIINDEKSNLYYRPSCVRIERCGGCCALNLFTCTPIESELVNVEVFVWEYTGGSRMKLKETTLVSVEKHTKCKCLCKTQPKDCTKLQRYNKDTCSCECDNRDLERKCRGDYKNRIWNKETCSCICREELECSTGLYFDPVSCRCEVQEGRTRQTQRPWIA